MEKPDIKIKNPIVKIGLYILMAMIIGIGSAWVILGIISPILLILLLKK